MHMPKSNHLPLQDNLGIGTMKNSLGFRVVEPVMELAYGSSGS